jgi:hypothetical protein
VRASAKFGHRIRRTFRRRIKIRNTPARFCGAPFFALTIESIGSATAGESLDQMINYLLNDIAESHAIFISNR